jgi:hypothetical protein
MAKLERYFLHSGTKARGPFTREELASLQASGALPADCFLIPESGGAALPVTGILPEKAVFKPSPVDSPAAERPYSPVIDAQFSHDAVTSRIGSRQGIAYEQIGWGIGLAALLCLFFPSVFFLVPYIFLAASLSLLAGFYIIWRRMRRTIDTPTSKARSAAIGQAELTGRVIALNNLFGPYSQLPCVICEYQTRTSQPEEGVELPLLFLRLSGQWEFFRKSNGVLRLLTAPFLLEDESGTILVDPEGAQLELTNEYHRWDYETSLGNGTMACERVVAPGEELYVLGRVDLVSGADGSSHRMVHKGEKGTVFYIFRGRENRLLKRMKGKMARNLLAGVSALIIALIMLGF